MQYGFRSSRSTADVLTVLTDRLSRALDNNFDAWVIALDISKAFDKVWHKGLLHKLEGYGINGRVLPIIKSFLTGRTMKVVINGPEVQRSMLSMLVFLRAPYSAKLFSCSSEMTFQTMS